MRKSGPIDYKHIYYTLYSKSPGLGEYIFLMKKFRLMKVVYIVNHPKTLDWLNILFKWMNLEL